MQWETKSSLKRTANERLLQNPFTGPRQAHMDADKRSVLSVESQRAQKRILVRDPKRAVDLLIGEHDSFVCHQAHWDQA